MNLFRAHGLTIASDLPIHLSGETRGGPCDITLARGAQASVPNPDPFALALVDLRDPSGALIHRLERQKGECRILFPWIPGHFRGDRLLTTVTAHASPDAPHPDTLNVLASGAVIAMHLALNGHFALHASAVEVGPGALAFVGRSGMGKSTLATMFAAAGHPLVSDDILRVRFGDNVTAFRGESETRLRDGSKALADAVGEADRRRTADGRTAVKLRTFDDETLPLSCIIIPLLSRTHDRVVAKRLSEREAAGRLLAFPRVVGWRDPENLKRSFHAVSEVAKNVPVWDAVVPWGTVSSTLSSELLEAVEL